MKRASLHGFFFVACGVLLHGCAAVPVLTSTKVRDPQTSLRARCNLTLVDAPAETVSAWLGKDTPTGSRATPTTWMGLKIKDSLDSLRGKPGVKVIAFPVLIASDGEKVGADAQEPMRYVSAYNDDLTPKSYKTSGLGMKWSCAPTIKDQTVAIELRMEYRVLDSWIEYLSTRNEGGKSIQTVLKQPLFNTETLNTTLRIKNGETLIFGGLLREDSTERFGKTKASRRALLEVISVELLDEHSNVIPVDLSSKTWTRLSRDN